MITSVRLPVSMAVKPLHDRAVEQIREWGIVTKETRDTPDSLLVFGNRGSQPVVLKVIKRVGDEWRSGEALEAFDGRGVVRALGFVDGAVLMERLVPGTSVSDVALDGRDDEATEILARVMHDMSPRQPARAAPTVGDLSSGFSRYLASGDRQIPAVLVEDAQRTYVELSESQTSARLLHGDLHHYNVLLDRRRGWLAIDPKGVVGEVEYEIGACLRNPLEKPELFTFAGTVERRLRIFEAVLSVDSSRALRWGFAQAVLAATWLVEDGFRVEADNPFLVLARATQSMLRAS